MPTNWVEEILVVEKLLITIVSRFLCSGFSLSIDRNLLHEPSYQVNCADTDDNVLKRYTVIHLATDDPKFEGLRTSHVCLFHKPVRLDASCILTIPIRASLTISQI